MPNPNAELRGARDRAGLSRAELADAVSARVWRNTGRRVGIDAHYVARLERGVVRWPGSEYRAALRAVLGTSTDAALGLAPPATTPRAGRDVLLDLAVQAETTDVTPTALDTVDVVADTLARAYATTDPAALLDEVQSHARQVGTLLETRATLAQRRRLLVAGGWLALLAATLHVDLGARGAAAKARAVASSLDRETEHGEIGAWAVEIDTWAALVDQDWPRAAALAAAGENVAPAGSGAAVQLAAQTARAAARLGDGVTVRAALDRAARAADRQPAEHPRDHHFVFDARKLHGYTATALAWLGDPAGEAQARAVVDTYADSGPPRRLATARVDLGMILARQRRPEEAAHLGILAVESDRLVPSNVWRVGELDDVLTDYRDVPEVADLHDLRHAAR